MWIKIRNFIHDSCDILELIMAVVVVIAIFVAGVSLWQPFMEFIENRYEADAFFTFIGYVFNVLIGIEFLKMLSQPSLNTVLEVLTFMVARHMVIEKTTVLENLLSIISIGVLFAIKKYLNLPTKEGSTDIFNNSYEKPWRRGKQKKRQEHESEFKN